MLCCGSEAGLATPGLKMVISPVRPSLSSVAICCSLLSVACPSPSVQDSPQGTAPPSQLVAGSWDQFTPLFRTRILRQLARWQGVPVPPTLATNSKNCGLQMHCLLGTPVVGRQNQVSGSASAPTTCVTLANC